MTLDLDSLYTEALTLTLARRAEIPSTFRDNHDEPFLYSQFERGNTLAHLVEEHHFSLLLLNFLHNSIAPSICAEPSVWTIFKEGASHKPEEALQRDFSLGNLSIHGYSKFDPIGAYLCVVAAHGNVPFKDPIVKLNSREVKHEGRNKGIHADVIDACELFFELMTWGDDYKEKLRTDKNRAYLSRLVNRPVEDVLSLTRDAFSYFVDSKGRLTKQFIDVIAAWNQVNTTNILRLLSEHRDRQNVLICVGEGHLESVVTALESLKFNEKQTSEVRPPV